MTEFDFESLGTPAPGSGKASRRVATQIRREILAERWGAGHRIGSELDLMARYGVGRSTLREAVRQLEALGAISTRPGGGGGLIVAESPAEATVRGLATYLELIDAGIDELFEARTALESAAAAGAAQRADDDQIATLRWMADQLEAGASDEDRIIRHVELRTYIAKITGNPALEAFIAALSRFAVEGWLQRDGRTPPSGPGLTEAAEAKRAIVFAIVCGDGAEAARATREDLEIRRQILHRLYAERPQGPSAAGGVKLGQRLATRMAHEIIERGLQEGDRLGAELDLMKTYGVSRSTFREALRILESHGIARTRRGIGGGVQVGRPDPTHTVETASDFLRHLALPPRALEEVRGAGSVAAARLAARRASTEDRQRLRDLLAAQLASQGDDATIVAAANVQIQIGDMSGNRALGLMMRVAIATIWRERSTSVPHPAFEELQANHVALVEAVASGDEALASRRMLRHMQFVRRRLEEIERARTRGP